MNDNPILPHELAPDAACDEAGIGRLRWRCRRGMLELDLLLETFLDRAYPASGPEVQAAFRRLLELGDMELLDICCGQAEPPDAACRAVLEAMRRQDA